VIFVLLRFSNTCVFEKRRHIHVPHHRLLKNGFFSSLLKALDSSFADGIEARAAHRNRSPTRFARSSCHKGRRVCGFRWNDDKDKSAFVQNFPNKKALTAKNAK
jgi:hypothetical protein